MGARSFISPLPPERRFQATNTIPSGLGLSLSSESGHSRHPTPKGPRVQATRPSTTSGEQMLGSTVTDSVRGFCPKTFRLHLLALPSGAVASTLVQDIPEFTRLRE